MRNFLHYRKLLSPKMRFPLLLSSYQLTILPLSLYFPLLPLHLLSFAGKSNDTPLTIKRPFTDIPAKPIHHNRPIHTESFQFIPDLYRVRPILLTKLLHPSTLRTHSTTKRKGVDPVYSTPSRDALFSRCSSLLLQGFNLAITEKTCTEIPPSLLLAMLAFANHIHPEFPPSSSPSMSTNTNTSPAQFHPLKTVLNPNIS